MKACFILAVAALTASEVLCTTQQAAEKKTFDSSNKQEIKCTPKFILLHDVSPSSANRRNGIAAPSVWQQCNKKRECSLANNTAVLVNYSCEFLEDIQTRDACSDESGLVATPFYLHTPDYPGSFNFKKGHSCNCRLYTLSLLPFKLTVKHFNTSLGDRLQLTWRDNKKYIASENDQGVNNVADDIVDAELKFQPSRDTTGIFWIQIEAGPRSNGSEKLMVQCQNRPFKSLPTAKSQRNRLVINNAVPIVCMAGVGVIALFSFLISDYVKARRAKAKARKHGGKLTSITAPPSGQKPNRDKPNLESHKTRL